jgi:hypothetical protein
MSDKPADNEPREVSPEEYRQMVSTGQINKKQKTPVYLRKGSNMPTILAVVICVSLLFGFFGGIAYEKGKVKTTNIASTSNASGINGQNRFGGPGGFRRGGGAIGAVTAVSDSSITVNNQRTGSDQTFKITSSTTILSNGNSATASDIKTGDTVLIRTSTSDTSTATSILINPSFGGAQPDNGGTPNQSNDNSSTDGSSSSTNSIDAPSSNIPINSSASTI